MKLLKKIVNRILKRCPECGAKMKSKYIDIYYDRPIYKCTSCKKEFI